MKSYLMALTDHPVIIRKDSTDTELTDGKIVFISFMCVINVFMFLGNCLSLLTISYTRSLRSQVSYWFVFNLAVIDLIISITVVPLNTIWEYYGVWPFSDRTCSFFTFADTAFSTISAYSIVLVSVDKYVYISYSIQYYDRMTRKLALILIVTVWCLVLILTTVMITTKFESDKIEEFMDSLGNETHPCIFVMTDEYVIPVVILCFFVPFIILCFTSSKIVCIAIQHIRKIHTTSNSSVSETDSDVHNKTKSRPRKRRHTVSAFSSTMSLATNNIHAISHNSKSTVSNCVHQTTSSPDVLDTSFTGSKLSRITQLGYDTTTIKRLNSIIHEEPENIQTNNDSPPQPEEHHIKSTTANETDKHSDQPTDDDKQNCYEKPLSPTAEEPELTSDKQIQNKVVERRKSNSNGLVEGPTKRIPKDIKDETNNSQSLTNANENKKSTTADIVKNILQPKAETFRNKTSLQPKTSSVRKTSVVSGSLKSVTTVRRRYPYCKLFGTVTIVIACFVIMFAPYYVVTLFDIWCHCIEPWVYEDILAVMYYMHSLVNPYIYMLTDRKYKAALRLLWKKMCSKH